MTGRRRRVHGDHLHPRPSLGCRILGWLSRWIWTQPREIRGRRDSRLYLTRWHLLGSRGSRWSLMLHRMHRPDPDLCCHDHPWWFLTLVLAGGYEEEVEWGDGWSRTLVRNRPGRVRYRPAVHRHRISRLPQGECWTLVIRGPRVRSWGFWAGSPGARMWVYWRDFLASKIPWCG